MFQGLIIHEGNKLKVKFKYFIFNLMLNKD